MKKLQLLILVALFFVGTAHAATFTVNVTTDGSDANPGNGVCNTGVGSNCTLRAAIQEANAFAGTDTIEFSIGSPGGIRIITPNSPVPVITQPVIIDGWTQGAAGYTGSPLIEIVGTNAVAGSGLEITAGGSTVRGLAINRFPSNGITLRTSGGNTIEACYLGTDAATGAVDRGNARSGIEITSLNNLIGGLTAARRNVISGNDQNGILVSAGANVIIGNYIGTDATGSAALGNDDSGIILSSGNRVGGTTAGERNVISGNNEGITLNGDGSTITGNYIGTDANGTADLGNNFAGVYFLTSTSSNRIGGAAAGEANKIAFNDFGVLFSQPFATAGNSIRGNSIFSNDNLGIALTSGFNPTPNDEDDADTGENNLQNYPVLTEASNSGGATTIKGSLNSSASTPFTIDFFASARCDSSDFGEGETFLGSTVVTTNAGGDVSFSFTPASPVTLGQFITATTTRNNLPLDTSEFSECFQVFDANVLIVTTTADSGAGSLRQAIITAASIPGADQITFNIPGAGSVHTINLLSQLPDITSEVVINGATQPGFAGTPLIELNGAGAGAGAEGLVVKSNTSVTIRSLIINRFGGDGIELGFVVGGSADHTIRGCYIGTDATGTIDLGNGDAGIVILGSGNNRIGGSAAARNVISGNGKEGIRISSGSTGNVISGNHIGTTASGTALLGNSNVGIRISTNSSGTIIGGDSVGERNVISGNTTGIFIDGSGEDGAGGNVITGNHIGTSRNGTAGLGNSSGGIEIRNSANNRIGGTTASERNVISGNSAFGDNGAIEISGALSTGNKITGNYIGSGADGTADLGNAKHGIRIFDAATNQIGGTLAGEGNVIAFNGSSGVYIFQVNGAATGNSISTLR